MTPVDIEIDGHRVQARPGDTVAVAMLRAGAHYDGDLSGRGLFCGMGSCYECHAEVNGEARVRTCMIEVRPGMRIRTGTRGSAIR